MSASRQPLADAITNCGHTFCPPSGSMGKSVVSRTFTGAEAHPDWAIGRYQLPSQPNNSLSASQRGKSRPSAGDIHLSLTNYVAGTLCELSARLLEAAISIRRHKAAADGRAAAVPVPLRSAPVNNRPRSALPCN